MTHTPFQRISLMFLGASARLIIALALLLVAVPCSRAADVSAAEAGTRDPLVGTWEWQATYSQVAPGFPDKFAGAEIFNSDGTMEVVTNLPGVTIGMGVWKPTGFGTYTLTVTFYRQDPRFPLMLPSRINVNLKLVGENNYATTDVLMPLDPFGQPLFDPSCPGIGGLCTFNGTVAGKRHEFGNWNMLLP